MLPYALLKGAIQRASYVGFIICNRTVVKYIAFVLLLRQRRCRNYWTDQLRISQGEKEKESRESLWEIHHEQQQRDVCPARGSTFYVTSQYFIRFLQKLTVDTDITSSGTAMAMFPSVDMVDLRSYFDHQKIPTRILWLKSCYIKVDINISESELNNICGASNIFKMVVCTPLAVLHSRR